MKHRNSQTLFDYWNEVRGHRVAPRRFEIEPARIAAILPSTFILERRDSETYCFRLAGTRICDDYGREFRGANFLELWGDSDRITLERQFSFIADQVRVGVFTFDGFSAEGDCATFEALVLPLLHTGMQVTRFVGAIAPLEGDAWLGRKPVVSQHLLSHQMFYPDGEPYIGGRGEPPPFNSHVRGARLVRQDRRQFRVYEGGLSGTPPRR